MRIAGVECLLRNSIRNPVMLPVMAVLLVLALSAATPPDSAKADAIADAFPLPQEEGGRGEGEGGSAGGRGAGRGTSKDPFRILPEGPAEDGDNECAHLAGRMLLCMASYQSWQRSMREEAGGTGNATLPHSQSQEQDDCKEAVTEHWNCVSSQAKSSYLGGYTRIRKVRHGYMCFSPFDIYFAVALELYGEWGEEEATVMTSLISPGDTVVEVGGHMGTLTLPLAKRVGPTGTYVVFEPQRLLSQYNAANIALNGLSQVRLLQVAAGERSGGKATMVSYRPDQMRNLGGAVLSEEKEEDAHEAFEQVDIVSIDSLELASLQLIKLDCEGCEEGALIGAKRTIAWFTPVVYREWNMDRPSECGRGEDYLLSLNYSCWVHTTSAFNPNNFYGQETNYFAQNGRSTIAVMLLCVPPRVTLSAQWSDGGVKLLAESTMRPLKCMSDPTNLA